MQCCQQKMFETKLTRQMTDESQTHMFNQNNVLFCSLYLELYVLAVSRLIFSEKFYGFEVYILLFQPSEKNI